MNDTVVHCNWALRGPDERFHSVNDIIDNAQRSKENSVQSYLSPDNLKFIATNDGDILLKSIKSDALAGMTNFGCKNISAILGVPHSFLTEKLDNHAAAAVLNYRLSQYKDRILGLFEKTSTGPVLQAVSTPKYTRVFDVDVIRPMSQLVTEGNWYAPIARPNGEDTSLIRKVTEEDIGKHQGRGGIQVQLGDDVVTSGLFRGDRNCCVMFQSRDGEDDGFGHPLFRVAVMTNSQVYGYPFEFMDCTVQGVCGNLLLHEISQQQEVSFRHVGLADWRIQNYLKTNIRRILDTRANFDGQRKLIKAFRATKVAATKDEVIEKIYKMKIDPVITKSLLDTGIELAAKFRNVVGDPYSYYGVFDGLTRASQTFANSDTRMDIDRAVGVGYGKVAQLLGV